MRQPSLFSVHRLVRSPRPLQLLDRRCDLAPNGCTLFVAFASENHRLRSRVKLSVFAVSVDRRWVACGRSARPRHLRGVRRTMA